MQIKVAGLSTHVELEGPVNADVVMFSHSLGFSLDMWQPQLEALRGHYRILRYDIRGHGASEAPTCSFTLGDLANDVRGILEHFQIPKVHLVGLSLGGMIGQELGVRYPSLLKSLVLADTVSAYGPEAATTWRQRIDAVSKSNSMESLVEPTLERWFTEPFRRSHPDVVSEVRTAVRRTSVKGYMECSRVLASLNLTRELRAVGVPTLVLTGDHDQSAPESVAKIIVAAIPNAKLEIIRDAAHISNIEQPAIFTSLLTQFWQGLQR